MENILKIRMNLGFTLTRRIKILLIILALLGASIAGAYAYLVNDPSANNTCSVCHSIQPYVQDISNTEHGEFNCHTCHELTPGVVNEIIVYLMNNPNSTEIYNRWSGNIPQLDQCLKCHTYEDVLNGTTFHSLHYGEEEFGMQPCTVCHNPHQPDTTYQLCSKCHKGGVYEE